MGADSGPHGETGPMDAERFQTAVKGAADDAADYIDGFIAPLRAQATQYYRGEPFGNEEEGRSQIVMTEVRDVTQAIIPSLLRIFTSSEKVVEFSPRNAATLEQAEQATDYVNLVFYNDNPGFAILHSAFKDALVRKTGIIKWRWSKDVSVTETEFEGLDQGQVIILQQEPTVEILDLREKPGESQVAQGDPQAVSPAGVSPPPPPSTYDVRIRRKIQKNRVVVEALPPEEFLIARTARDVETASYCGHRSYKTMSDLVAMGYDRDELEDNLGGGDVFALNTEAQTRNPAIMSFMDGQDRVDPSMRSTLYVESFMKIDKDGDGIAELRKVCSIGAAHHILHDEIVDEAPFAMLCPDPEPHMAIGASITDQTSDLQLLKSNVVRATLDSLSQTIHPRMVVVEGQVNMDDVMNNETGAIIRARAPGMVTPLAEPFVGQGAMPVIAWLDQVRAARTGISGASQGLDPDVMQSTTAKAVSATVTGAQERIELIARLFGETGVKRMFKGIYRMVIKNQDEPRMVRMRGKFVTVDPRTWDSDLDVRIDIALGRGTDQDKMQFLMLVAQKQEQIIQMLGPMNPLCDVMQLRNTYSQICGLGGFKNADLYFKQIDPQQMQAMASQPPKPDPNMMLIEIEKQKLQIDGAKQQHAAQMNEREQAAKELEIHLKDQLAREKLRQDGLIALAEIEAKYGTMGNLAAIEHIVSTDRANADRDMDVATQVHSINTQANTARHATETQAAVDRHAALVQAQTAAAQAAAAPPSG